MSLLSAAQIEQFHDLGYLVTEPVFSTEQLDAVSAEFDRLHREVIAQAEREDDEERQHIARYRPFIGQVHSRSEVLAEFVKAPIYLEACRTFIGPDADLYYNQAVIKPPEKGMAFAWHQDSGYVVTEPLEYITCWTAISRSFVENGCIWLIPKSHRQGLLEHEWREDTRSYHAPADESRAIPVPMERGQVAVFSSLTLHKSGENTSSEVRQGYVPQYHVPGVVKRDTGKPWGDQFPVLRGGHPV